MTAHSTAQGIASLGRHGDDMIVHMNRDEVKGLQALAQAHGASLSINPHTGMPEAFSLGGVFKSLLPMAAGFALPAIAPEVFGATGMFGSAAPLMTGLAVGATTGLISGNMGQGLMAGLGAYGGAGLHDMFAKMGTTGALNAQNVTNANQLNTGANLIGGTSATNSLPVGGGYDPLTGFGGGVKPDMSMVNPNLAASNTSMFNNTAATNIANQGSGSALTGIKNLVSPNNAAFQVGDKIVPAGSGWSQFTNPAVGGSAMKLAMPIGGALLGGVEASDLNPNVNLQANARTKHVQTGVDSSGKPIYGDIELTKYSPYETLNINNPYGGYPVTPPPSLVLPPTVIAKEGGEVQSYAIGGVVSNPSVGGGTSDLYNRPEGQTTETISQDGYGIGRLDSLANAESINTAKTLGYADGGNVVAGDTGMNIDSLPSLNLNTGTTNPGITAVITQSDKPNRSGLFNNAGIDFGAHGRDDSSNYRSGPLGNAGINFSSDNRNGLSFRTIGMAEGGDVGMNLNDLPTLNVNTGASSLPDRGINNIDANTLRSIMYKMTPLDGKGLSGREIYDQFALDARNKGFSLDTMRVQGRAKGGYLDGQGDGMSDSIPATIEGKQPARLADGEFVVPADVVSHLGNGSSKAGSKRLYSMLDKVRKARTGSTKQGKQINPNKYLPA